MTLVVKDFTKYSDKGQFPFQKYGGLPHHITSHYQMADLSSRIQIINVYQDAFLYI